MMRSIIVLSLALLLVACKHEKEYSGNPIVEGWYADPEGVVFDDEYWIYPTLSDIPFGADSADFPGLQKETRAIHQVYNIQTYMDAFSSKDMVHWTKHPKVLSVENIKWLEFALWAPSIVRANGKYYLFFGGNDIQNDEQYGGIGVAVADNPAGPFKDVLGKPLIDKIVNGAQPIDQFDLTDGNNCTNYADTIPFSFNDVNSFCTLYYDSLQSRLYAVTNYNYNNKSNINIYSLAYPPLKIEDTLQTVAGHKARVTKIGFFIGIGICIIAGMGCMYLCYRKKKRRRKESHIPHNPPVVTNTDRSSKTTTQDENYKPQPDIHKKSSILFLDGFQVWDKNGADITKSFTPILKQLLILIILYSVNNKKGISNVTLRELLWFDKTDESAQNNRRVNIRKLKLLLEKLDGVELVKESTYWALKFTHAYCDYIDVCNWIDKVKNKEPITAENINDLPLNLLSGQLLPYVQTDWLDSFKSDYTNSVLDMAINLSKQEYIKGNNELLIQIANSMFAHDKTDEYALILKCNTLYKQGRTSLAKTTFDTFCNEYKAMLNTNYTKTFNEIINCQL